jgi:hypothetical protein
VWGSGYIEPHFLDHGTSRRLCVCVLQEEEEGEEEEEEEEEEEDDDDDDDLKVQFNTLNTIRFELKTL